jgi:Uma2 family endonuclease
MATTTTRLVTVEEFRNLPEGNDVYYELRAGEVVPVTRPKHKHFTIQRRLRRLLEQMAPPDGVVDTEFAFRAVSEYDLRVADVAYVSEARFLAIDPEDNLHGAPDITIEVLSRSNTAAEIFEKEKLCLENGAQEFWVVDPRLRQVRISTPDARTITWRSGQEIPLSLFGEALLKVDDIFGA